jgi:hypothetical protein
VLTGISYPVVAVDYFHGGAQAPLGAGPYGHSIPEAFVPHATPSISDVGFEELYNNGKEESRPEVVEVPDSQEALKLQEQG